MEIVQVLSHDVSMWHDGRTSFMKSHMNRLQDTDEGRVTGLTAPQNVTCVHLRVCVSLNSINYS